MNKLRSDSAFCQLTPKQSDILEGWLFEERLSYPKVVERLKTEFGLETSLTGVRRYYKRVDLERSAMSLMDAAEMSGLTIQALKSGELKSATMLYANKCLFDLLRQEPVPIKEVTRLMRAITSAEARAFRQTVDDREQAELKERERRRKVEAEWRITPRDLAEEKEELRQQREARKKAKENEKLKIKNEKGAQNGKDCKNLTARGKPEQRNCDCSFPPHPGPLPRGEGETTAAVVASDASRVAETIEEDASGEWQPSVVEGREDAEDRGAEAAENRLTPLNAA